MTVRPSDGFQWANNKDIVYACLDSDVTIPWRVALTTGENISKVEWFFHGPHTISTLAVFTDGHFHVMDSVTGNF